MSKTVGMITIYRKNYGAFLQAYALQKTLQKAGYAPEIIQYDYYRDHALLGMPLVKLKQPIVFCKAIAVEILRYKQHKLKADIFVASIKRHIVESKAYYRTYDRLAANPPQYDCYLTGSDQVFNPRLSPQAFKARLLCFVREGVKVSYAASAGDNSVPGEYADIFARALRTFAHISVRETGLSDYLKKELDIAATVHVDPTFLLTKEEWSRFAEDATVPENDYIFYYRVLPQEALKRKAKELSEKLGLPVFVADGNDKFAHQVERKGILSPEAWVGMLLRASYVVTNSFHGAAFAVNLQKRASIFVPPTGGERVKNLLGICNLHSADREAIMPEELDKTYADAVKYLSRERESAMTYLTGLSHQ